MSALEEVAHLADIPIELEVELGRKTLTVRQILALAPGTVLSMARSAGENIDIRVDGAIIGSAEIVIIEDNFGVRITDFVEE